MAKDDKPERTITLEELEAIRASGAPLNVIDVRSAEEFAATHVPGAINVPLEQLLAGQLPDLPRNAEVVTVCNRGGSRSQGAAERLRALGWSSARALCGGVSAWRESEQSKPDAPDTGKAGTKC